MRKDQVERLADISEKVADVFIMEADPDNWNGCGTPMQKMDNDTRGNRLWDKRNAVQTGTLLTRIIELRERAIGMMSPITDDDAEQEIKRHEKAARKLLNEALERAART